MADVDLFGYQAKAAIGAANPPDKPLPFVSESFQATRTAMDDDQVRGTRSQLIGNTRYGPESFTGQIVCRPTAKMLVDLLPWILGGTPVGTSYPLAETIPERYLSIDRSDGTAEGKVFLYSGVKVARATFNCVAGAPWTLTLDLMALTETVGAAGSHPVIAYDSTTRPFILSDIAISVNAVTICTPVVNIIIDNALEADELTNCSTGPAALLSFDRLIDVSFTPSWGRVESLYPPTDTGWATTVTLTDGTVSCLFDMPTVVYNKQSPTIEGKRSKIRLPLNGRAKATTPLDELEITLDSTV
jgi:hypothetical protein